MEQERKIYALFIKKGDFFSIPDKNMPDWPTTINGTNITLDLGVEKKIIGYEKKFFGKYVDKYGLVKKNRDVRIYAYNFNGIIYELITGKQVKFWNSETGYPNFDKFVYCDDVKEIALNNETMEEIEFINSNSNYKEQYVNSLNAKEVGHYKALCTEKDQSAALQKRLNKFIELNNKIKI